MNKTNLVDMLVAQHDMTRVAATAAVNSVLENIAEALSRGETVSLVGFGSFVVCERSARTGRNPQNGAAIQIPASKRVKFRVGKNLQCAVNVEKGKCCCKASCKKKA